MKYYILPRVDNNLYRGDEEEGLIYVTYPSYFKGWYKVRTSLIERWADRIRVPDTYAILRGINYEIL